MIIDTSGYCGKKSSKTVGSENIQVSPSFIPLKANWVNLSLIDKNAVFHLNKMSHIAPKFDREIEREKCLDLQLSAVSRRS